MIKRKVEQIEVASEPHVVPGPPEKFCLIWAIQFCLINLRDGSLFPMTILDQHHNGGQRAVFQNLFFVISLSVVLKQKSWFP